MPLRLLKIKTLTPLFVVFIVLYSCNKDDEGGDPPPIVNEFMGEIEYVKTFGGSNEDDAVSMVQDIDGSYLILGTTSSNDGDIIDKTTTDADLWLLKLSPDGQIIWSKTYGGSLDDKATRITKTSDGGFLLTGYSMSDDGDVSSNEGFHDYWLVKINRDGIIQWDRNYGFSGSDQSFDAFQTSDGGYFLSGFLDVTASGGLGNDIAGTVGNPASRNGNLHGVGEYWGIKLDANGVKEWRRYFGGTMNDRSYDALETTDGGFLMVGYSESEDFDIIDSKGSYDFWAVRLNSSGDKLWTKSFGGSEIDQGFAVTHSGDGNYILAGDSRSADGDITTPLGNADTWIVKFNDSGNLIWQKSFGGSQFESARSITPLLSGNYLVSGSSRSDDGDITDNKGQNDAWILILNEQGTLEFQISSGGSSLDFSNYALEMTDGSIVAVGNTESNDGDITLNKGVKDFLIVKIN